MAKTPWLKNGVPVLVDGKPVLCSTCPCEAAGCFDHCENGLLPITVQAIFGAGFADADCAGGECNNVLPGTYLLDLKYVEENGAYPTIPAGPYTCTNIINEIAFGNHDAGACAVWCYYKQGIITSCAAGNLDLNIWLILNPTYWCLEMFLYYSGFDYTHWVWEASRTDKSSCTLEEPLEVAKGEVSCGGLTETAGTNPCTTAGPDPVIIQAA